MSKKAATKKKTPRTATPEQIETNRANAAKSTGPRTPEGKARSSRNACKHGLLARHLIPQDDPVENPDELSALIEELTRQFNPCDLFETLCVKRLAACYWRLDRAMRFESVAINRARENDQTPMAALSRGLLGTPQPDPATFVLPSAPDLDRLVRYEYMIDRELQRTLTQLHQHRANTPQDEIPETPPIPVPDKPTPPAPSLKFQISNLQSLPLPPSAPAPAPPSQSTTFPHAHPSATPQEPQPPAPTEPAPASSNPQSAIQDPQSSTVPHRFPRNDQGQMTRDNKPQSPNEPNAAPNPQSEIRNPQRPPRGLPVPDPLQFPHE